MNSCLNTLREIDYRKPLPAQLPELCNSTHDQLLRLSAGWRHPERWLQPSPAAQTRPCSPRATWTLSPAPETASIEMALGHVGINLRPGSRGATGEHHHHEVCIGASGCCCRQRVPSVLLRCWERRRPTPAHPSTAHPPPPQRRSANAELVRARGRSHGFLDRLPAPPSTAQSMAP
jgi:hypothetical protein